MKIFLIRHGETVDNVAQVYAGIKDSALTIHGSLQAERLGKFLAQSGLRITHIFSSDLQRAVKTASAIRSWNDAAQPGGRIQVTSLKLLREQDFGFYEGKPFCARARDSKKSGKEIHRSQHQEDPNFKDVESKDSMAARINEFNRDHLVPLLNNESGGKEKVIAIVSHGIILSRLWGCFLKLLPKTSVTLSPELPAGTGRSAGLEYLGGWSNTGYLELDIQNISAAATKNGVLFPASSRSPEPPNADPDSTLALYNYRVVVKTVNGKEHLQGLKRTKGGVGSSKFDEGQKSIESFFKKRKLTNGQT